MLPVLSALNESIFLPSYYGNFFNIFENTTFARATCFFLTREHFYLDIYEIKTSTNDHFVFPIRTREQIFNNPRARIIIFIVKFRPRNITSGYIYVLFGIFAV